MANKSSGKKGATLAAFIAVMAFFGGAQAASAARPQPSPPPAPIVVSYLAPELASWWEEASWSES